MITLKRVPISNLHQHPLVPILSLFEAHVHDSDNACGERCLDDEFEVSEVDGLAVE